MDFKEADFSKLMELIGKIPWEASLRGKMFRESESSFSETLLMAQEHTIHCIGKIRSMARAHPGITWGSGYNKWKPGQIPKNGKKHCI